MEDKDKVLRQCLERLLLDFLDIHGFLNGRKAEITLVAGIIMLMSVFQKLQMKDIAAIFNVSNSTVTDYINYLENKEFVRRVRSNEDRREVFIEVTDKGKDWISRNRQITWDYIDERLSGLTPEEQATFVSLLAKFMGNTEKSPYTRIIDVD